MALPNGLEMIALEKKWSFSEIDGGEGRMCGRLGLVDALHRALGNGGGS